MSDSIRIGKRAFTLAVATATILWSVGFAAFVAPLTARAAVAGDLVRGETLSTVYYMAGDGNRYAFPNEKTFFTWHSDFSGIVTMSDAAIADIPLAGNIVYRPGSRWIKIQSDPKTYAVGPQGSIWWIETEAVAVGLAGDDWNMNIDDVADVFFVDYNVGPSLVDASAAYNGAVISGNYLVWNGVKRELTDAGFTGNRFQSRFILDGTGINADLIANGTTLAGLESELVDDAQLGGVTTGGLMITLASDTPASATVPRGASSVPFTKIKLTATSGSVDLDQLIFRLGGVGNVNDISKSFLFQDGARLTDGRSVNSTTREVTFSALNLHLNDGESTYIELRADTSTTATGGDTANFGLTSTDSISGSATVTGSFPVIGNTMSFSETNAGRLEIDKTGSITDPTLGEADAIIGRFKAQAHSEDANIYEMTLKIDDAADHSNYMLLEGDVLVASGTWVGKDLVRFVFANPFFIAEGNTRNFKVTADIGGKAADKIKVAIDEEADVLALGGDFGFNLAIDIGKDTTDTGTYSHTGGACTSSANECSYSVIQGGELTFAFNGPPSDDIQVDGEDEVLMLFSITSQNITEIKEIDVILAEINDADNAVDDGGLLNDTQSNANVSDITIRRLDGSAWMGPEELVVTNASVVSADDVTQTLSFTNNQYMAAGETLDLMITVDTSVNAVATDVLRATLDMSGVQAEDSNGDDLINATDIVPSSDLVGNQFTLKAATLTIEKSEPPSSATYVKGAANVPVVAYSFEAGDASLMKVTDLTLNVDGDSDGTWSDEDDITVRNFVNSCSLYDNELGTLLDGPKSFNTSEEAVFNNFSWEIPAGETKKMLVKCNYANVALDTTVGGATDAYVFYIDEDGAGSTADVTAEDDDGDDVTPIVVSANSNDPAVDAGEIVTSIVATGTLTTSLDGSSANSTIILGNSTDVSVATYKFNATTENFLVKDLTFGNCVNYDVSDPDDCTGGTGEVVGADNIASSVTIEYQNEAGDTKTKTGFLSNGAVKFSGLDFYVPTESTRTVKVMVNTASVSDTAATSGSKLQLNMLDSGGFDNDGGADDFTSEFKAVGSASGDTITTYVASDADVNGVAANNMVARKTKPTISLASGSPSGAGVPGLSEVLRFNVSADSRGSVTMNEVTFKASVAETGGWADCDAADLGDEALWKFYDLDDPSEELDDATDWTFYQSTGAACAGAVTANVGYAVLNLETSATHPAEEIGAGETKTYVLEVDTTGASSSSDDSIRIDIPSQSEIRFDGNGATDLGGDAADDPTFEWDDDSLAAGGSKDIGGLLLKNLPVVGGTIVY